MISKKVKEMERELKIIKTTEKAKALELPVPYYLKSPVQI
jgi:hypothetical protein